MRVVSFMLSSTSQSTRFTMASLGHFTVNFLHSFQKIKQSYPGRWGDFLLPVKHIGSSKLP